jgi:glycerol uptake facilitator-like aquaporin
VADRYNVPVVTLARSVTDTFSGIRAADTPVFIAAELAGAFCATFLFRWLMPPIRSEAYTVLANEDAAI